MMRKEGMVGKALILMLAGLLLSSGTAYAMPIIIDVGAAGIDGTADDGDTLTGAFNELGIYAETSSVPVNGSFNDVGDLKVTRLLPLDTTRDDEGLGADIWELTGRWENLAGNYTAPQYVPIINKYVSIYSYTSGDLELYAQGPSQAGGNPDADFQTLPLGSSDDVAATFTNGTHVASLSLTTGEGHLWFNDAGGTQPYSGDTLTFWEFTWMLQDFWRDTDLNDLSEIIEDVPCLQILGEVDSNTNQIYLDENGIHSAHDGSARINVIPEPASVLLLGSGIIGLAGLKSRKRKTAA